MSEMKALVDAVDAVTSRKRDSSESLAASASKRGRKSKKADVPREKLLEHNRLAASESRRRKKEMVEDLQRSVAFFSKANVSLKSQNAELERQILLAKQRMLAAENGAPSAAFAAPVAVPVTSNAANDLLGLLKSSTSRHGQQAQAAHFAATQAMYERMGFPPGAARAAASTFSQYVGQTGKLPGPSASASIAKSDAGLPTKGPLLTAAPRSTNEEQAQAAHFAATQALYNSMGFPPKAAKQAATTFSHCAAQTSRAPVANPQKKASAPTALAHFKSPEPRLNSGESYVEALNKFAMQQAAAANAAAAAATAAMQAAKFHSQQQSAAMVSPSSSAMPFGLSFAKSGSGGLADGASFNDFISKLQGSGSAGKN